MTTMPTTNTKAKLFYRSTGCFLRTMQHIKRIKIQRKRTGSDPPCDVIGKNNILEICKAKGIFICSRRMSHLPLKFFIAIFYFLK